MKNFDERTFNKKFGKIMRSARARAGLSISEASSLVEEVSFQKLSDVESGHCSIQGNHFYQLSLHYSFTMEEMMFICTIGCRPMSL